MAVNRVPVLKRCRSLGLDPIYLGIDKKSTRQLKRANRKMSEYGFTVKRKTESKIHLRSSGKTFPQLLRQS